MLRTLRGDRSEGRVERGEEIRRLQAAPTLARDGAVVLLTERNEAWADRKHEIIDAFSDFRDVPLREQSTRLAEIISDRIQHCRGSARGAY